MSIRDEELAARQSLERIGEKVSAMLRENEALKRERDKLLTVARDALVLIEALMPGVKHIPLQDYAALNNTPLALRAAIAQAESAS